MKQKVSDYIFEYLARTIGVDTVFLLPGGGCMHLVDSVGKRDDMRFVCCLHEQAAAIAAESYAQQRNGLGVTLVTAGPGSTNAITGVAGAWIDSTPLLVLSGQAKTTDMINGRPLRQRGIQEVDTAAIVAPLVKYARCVTDAKRIRYELEKAVHLALHGRRGPVWLDLPLDVQGATIDPEQLPGFVPPAEPDTTETAKTAAETVLEALRTAKRPLVYAGHGVRAAGALREFREWIEKLRLPTVLSWRAADFLEEEHPFFVGRPGIIAQRGANYAQQTCDVLVILGTRLDLCQTGFNDTHFAPKARKFMIDIDPAEMDKLETVLTGRWTLDAKAFLTAALAQNSAPPDCAPWLARCRDWQRKYPTILPAYCDETKPLVNLYHLVKVLGETLHPGDVLIPGSSGACAEVTMQAIAVKPGVRIHNTPGLGSMGFGVPALLGGALGAPGARVVGVVGDGGLMHNIQEFETYRRLGLPIKLFILNNNGYGSIRNMQDGRFAGHRVACDPGSGLSIPDLEQLTHGFGLPFRRIASPRDMAGQVAAVLETPGTVICEVLVDPEQQSVPRLSSRALPDGRMESLPMEELFPFLPAAEQAANLEVEP